MSYKEFTNAGHVQQLMPVIQALWEARRINLRPGVQDQPGQHGETPSLLKIQKLAGHGGIPVIPVTWEAETGESLKHKAEVALS